MSGKEDRNARDRADDEESRAEAGETGNSSAGNGMEEAVEAEEVVGAEEVEDVGIDGVAAEELGKFQRENAELLDRLMRLRAEFDNYRKRMMKEQTRIIETAESELVLKLLPVIDNLERALENAPEKKENRALREGVTMVLEQMLGILEKEGLEVVCPEGEPFDPEHHEAMMVVETDECPEGTVTGVVQKGYRFNGRMLRPAMVKVSCSADSGRQ